MRPIGYVLVAAVLATVAGATLSVGAPGLRVRAATVVAAAAKWPRHRPQAASATPPATAPPADVAARFRLTEIAHGLAKPVALTFAPGDPRARLFVVEKVG